MSNEIDIQVMIKELKKPEKFLKNQIAKLGSEEYKTNEDFHLYIKQLLWNEIEDLDHENAENILYCALALYYLDNLDIIDIRSLLSRYYFQNSISNFTHACLIFLILLNNNELPDDIIEFMRINMKDYGVNHLDLSELIKIADALGKETSQYDILSSKFESFENRPEYQKEIIENTDLDDLQFLQYWVTPDVKESIVNEIIKRKLENSEMGSYEKKLKDMNDDKYLQNFPLSHQIIGDDIASFEPRSIDMDELSDLTPELSRQWLPNFVYSKPELEENIRIYFPGGPNIGHSSIIVKSNFGSFMMDYGLSVVNTSKSQWLPIMEKLDFILISHAHLDHSGSLPIFYGKERKIPWFATEHTKIMTEMLWHDTRNILGRNANSELIEKQPYLKRLVSRGGIINTLENFNALKMDKSYKLSPTIEVKPHDAFHLFGSVGYEITIGGKTILYTGDFNMDKGAEFPIDADITMFDSTYFERYDKYPKPEEGLAEALKNSNRILIPAFSMGRSQEMLFKLKQLGADKEWKIYLTGMGGRLASKLSLSVGSNHGIREGGVNIVPTVKPEDFIEKTIVIGGQGMIQAGTSRNLFEESKDDEETTVILCGYQAPNTLGFHLLRKDPYLMGKYKQNVKRVKISGHTSGEKLDKFMDDLSNTKVMVHSPEGAFKKRKRQDVIQPDKIEPLKI